MKAIALFSAVFVSICLCSILPEVRSDSRSSSGITTVELTCENAVDPLGVDVAAPSLSWKLEGTGRGQSQSAYQIVAATNSRVLWNTGKVISDRTLHIPYAGAPQHTAELVNWKVRVWDQRGFVSAWSVPAAWTVGVIAPNDWSAQWIGADTVPDTSWTDIETLIGYHAAEAPNQNDIKWVQVDLGKSFPISSVVLVPVQHDGKAGFGFPIRFKIEASNSPDFTTSTTIVDQTNADYANPGATPVKFAAASTVARYVRITATKLWLRDTVYCFALHRLNVISGGIDVADKAPVTALDTVENWGWGEKALTGADFVAPVHPNGDSLLLRHNFVVKPGLKRAVAFVCGLGQYQMYLNGSLVNQDVLSPGWTVYSKTCLYDTYDITHYLQSGSNAVGLFLGNGMYNIHGGRYTKITGTFGPVRAIAMMRLEYTDGSTQVVDTNQSWRVHTGPITFSSIYGGEDYNARLLADGWDTPGFDDSDWKLPVVTSGPGGVLRGMSAAAPPIRYFGTLVPVGSTQLDPVTRIYDLGQNASIMLHLDVTGPAGSSVRVIPSEQLGPTGDIDDTMCGGNSYWTYTLKGAGDENYDSHFYYRGGRYLKVVLLPASDGGQLPAVNSISGAVIHADSPSVGEFVTSNDLVNKIYTLVRWAQLNNMVSIMTDCPTREKLGWLEEDHLNGPALRYNFDVTRLMRKMENDMSDSQRASGLVPSTCPDYPHWPDDMWSNPPEWGSACIAVPWQQYEFDGDLSLLKEHYSMMTSYVDYLTSKANNGIVSIGLGDWYDNRKNGPSTLTPIGLTATAFYYYDCQTVAKIATLLGNSADSTKYTQLAGSILNAFTAAYYNPTTKAYATGSQGGNGFILAMGLAAQADRSAILTALADDMAANGNTAGEVSLKYVLEQLAEAGRSDLIYSTFTSTTNGYGLQVQEGKTSLTEGWNGNASQDHFMFGEINEWFFRYLAGIQQDPSDVAFRKIVIKPSIVNGLNFVNASYDSASGKIVSDWKTSNGQVTQHVEIPVNTSAVIYVPTSNASSVRESGHVPATSLGVKVLSPIPGFARFGVGSGSYTFTGHQSL